MIEKDEIQKNVLEWVNLCIGPSFEFRKYQMEQVIDIIYNILNDVTEMHIIEAPTGSGKSFINMISAGVLADYYDKTSYILCSDLFLWQQYHDACMKYKKMKIATIKGQTGNYMCLLNGEDVRNSDCRMAGISWPAMMNAETRQRYGYNECGARCEYLNARRKVMRSKVVMMTYQLFLYVLNNPYMDSHGNLVTAFPVKDVMFCDECHNIPDIVSNQYAAKIKRQDFIKLGEIYEWATGRDGDLFRDSSYHIYNLYKSSKDLDNDLEEMFQKLLDPKISNEDIFKTLDWYANILCEFTDIVTSMEQQIKAQKQAGKTFSKDDVRIYKLTSWMRNYMCFWNDFKTAIAEVGSQYLLKQIEISNKTEEYTIVLRCTKEDYIVWKYLTGLIKHKVLCSATVGGRDAFEENIGVKYLDNTTTIFDRIPSTFNFEKSPIIFFNRWKMSYREKDKNFPKLMNAIYQIIQNKHPNEKGMIQTGSFENAKKIFNNAPPELKRRFLLYDDNREKNDKIQTHKNRKNSILIGPTLCEGVDLPDDNCRFIIILKMPYPSLADEFTKVKMKLFPLWYKSKTSNTIIQGIGRGIRNDKDYCTTYILDACFDTLLNETIDQYPPELVERINEFR